MANNIINKNKKNEILKIVLISVASVLGLLFVSYLIFLVSLGALDRFRQPFWLEDGRVYFGDKQCCDGERLHYFMNTEEIEKDMPIDVSVKPDTTIRIRMIFKGLNQYKKVQEQILEPAPTRSGFTLVEWGGSEIE